MERFLKAGKVFLLKFSIRQKNPPIKGEILLFEIILLFRVNRVYKSYILNPPKN